MNNLQVFFIFIPILAIILLALNLLLSPIISDAAKKTTYECGFLPIMEQTRNQFSISFYLTSMLFLIFDLEILTIFPTTVALGQIGIFGFSIFLIFTFILTIGFVLEIGSGAIKFSNIVVQKNETLNNVSNTTKLNIEDKTIKTELFEGDIISNNKFINNLKSNANTNNLSSN